MATDAKKPKGRKAPDTVELIVRRGALRRFDRLRQSTAELPVKLTWDRRLADRRAASQTVDQDHRRTERRRTPPFTWETADFLVVGNGTEAAAVESAARKPARASLGSSRKTGQASRKSDTGR